LLNGLWANPSEAEAPVIATAEAVPVRSARTANTTTEGLRPGRDAPTPSGRSVTGAAGPPQGRRPGPPTERGLERLQRAIDEMGRLMEETR